MRPVLLVVGVVTLLVAVAFLADAFPVVNIGIGVLAIGAGIHSLISIPKTRRVAEGAAVPALQMTALAVGIVLLGADRIWRGHNLNIAGWVCFASFLIPQWIRRRRETHGIAQSK